MSAPKDANFVRLPDGRRLGYAEYGTPDGTPIIEVHGNPSSRLGSALFDDAARSRGIRVIGIDRPGMGLSENKPGRTLLDWPDDVSAIVDALGIDRFSIVGGSGGVPSALACAFKIPERLEFVGILFGPGPPGTRGATAGLTLARRFQNALARYGPLWIGVLALRPIARLMYRNPEAALAKLFAGLPPADKKVLKQSDVKQKYVDTIREAFRSGTHGAALDFALNVRPWGFDVEDISIDVHLWHGEDDSIVPPAMGRYLAERLPNCHARFLTNEGHFSLLPNHADVILSVLVR